MRKAILFVLLTGGLTAAFALAAGGDMGTITEPLTDGSAGYPWLIEDLADFDVFAGNSAYWNSGVYTTLMTDIDLDGRSYGQAVVAPGGTAFKGQFDGNGHRVLNATIDTLADADPANDNSNLLGLFGKIGQNGEVSNLGIENISINSGSGARIGGVAGKKYSASIINCYVTGNITLQGGNRLVGGICGDGQYGSLSGCYFIGNINCGDNSVEVGGLCGESRGKIDNSFCKGTVAVGNGSSQIGGLCGQIYFNTINKCYSTVNVSVGSDCKYVGGLSGQSNGGRAFYSFWNTETSGQPYSTDGIPATTAQMKQASTYVGWDNGQWFIQEGVDYPSLAWQAQPGAVAITTPLPARTYAGNGAGEPYQIATAADLYCMSRRYGDWGGNFVLVADIDMSGISDYWPISNFSGHFDGAGHTIRNLTIDTTVICNTSHLGLFGLIERNGSVENVNVDNMNIICVKDSYRVGAIAGHVFSTTVNNCHANVNISCADDFQNIGGVCGMIDGANIINCSATGRIVGGDYSRNIGGVCGYHLCQKITRCWADVDITAGNNSSCLGGLCGDSGHSHGDDIEDCYACGDITGGENCNSLGGFFGRNNIQIYRGYSCGQVAAGAGSVNLGGFCGVNSNSVNGCYFLDSAGPDNGIGTSLPDALMKQQISFIAWDFMTPVWRMLREGEDTPRLVWQEVFDGDIAGLYGVDLVDFAYLANCWGLSGCDSGTDCGRADIDGSGDVGLGDLAAVAEDWLRK